MEPTASHPEIPYQEYRVIAHLLRAHVAQHGQHLQAMIAFGDLVTRGDTFDIDLLEIVEGWTGKRFGEFPGSIDLPLRGRLRLYFLTPEVFRDPERIEDREERQWVEDLLARVREGYEIIVEAPNGTASQVLHAPQGWISTFSGPPSGSVIFDDPYKLV
jgi:hypothetical protein